jgi:hypothetical protein
LIELSRLKVKGTLNSFVEGVNRPFLFLKSENGAFDDKGLGFWQRE